MHGHEKTCDNCTRFSGWDDGRGQCKALPEAIRPGLFFGGPGLPPQAITATGKFYIENCPSFREGADTGHKDYIIRQSIAGLIEAKAPVTIYHNDETGEWLWSVACVSDSEFWLDSFDTEKEAVAYCEKNGLPIVGKK